MVPGARSFGGLFFAIIFLEKFLQIIIFSNNFSRFFFAPDSILGLPLVKKQ